MDSRGNQSAIAATTAVVLVAQSATITPSSGQDVRTARENGSPETATTNATASTPAANDVLASAAAAAANALGK